MTMEKGCTHHCARRTDWAGLKEMAVVSTIQAQPLAYATLAFVGRQVGSVGLHWFWGVIGGWSSQGIPFLNGDSEEMFRNAPGL